MTTRNKPHKAADPRKVGDLKEKARQEASESRPVSGSNVNSILYGHQTENQRAAGAGEFDA